MQVTVDETLTAVHQCQLLTYNKGETVTGDIAAYLLRTGAAVSPADDDARALTEENTTGELDTAGDDGASDDEGDEGADAELGDDLDVPASTIDQVLEWVGDSQERALAAHAAEESRGDKARTRLLAKLTEIGVG